MSNLSWSDDVGVDDDDDDDDQVVRSTRTPARKRQSPPNNNNNHNNNTIDRNDKEDFRFGLVTLRSFGKACHVMDGFFGSLLLLYGVLISQSHLIVPIIMSLGIGTILMVRCMLGLCGIQTDLLHRQGLKWSGMYLSPIMASMFLILAIASSGTTSTTTTTYLDQHSSQLHIPTSAVHFLQNHHHTVWVTLVGLSILELIRFLMIPQLQVWLVELDTRIYYNNDDNSDLDIMANDNGLQHMSPSSGANRPWWWKSPSSSSPSTHHLRHHCNNDINGLQDPLLLLSNTTNGEPHWVRTNRTNQQYVMHDDALLSPQHDQHVVPLGFWKSWLGTSSRQHPQQSQQHGEELLDFESVQQEWASRSEEDPYWWSREEDETPIKDTTRRENDDKA